MARWGNALGGWRKQRRDSKGRFGSGGGSPYRQAVRASRKTRRADYRKISRKERYKGVRKAEARVDHQDRVAAARKQYGVNRKKQAAKAAAVVGVVAASAAVAYYTPKIIEHRSDQRYIKSGGVILYHTTPKNVGQDILAGKTHLRGSDYRTHVANKQVAKLFDQKIKGIRVESSSPKRYSVPKLPSAPKLPENATPYGHPVFFSNKHKGLARAQYGSRGWMKKKAKGDVSSQAMTLKLRYKGPLDTIEYDGWHWDNTHRGLAGKTVKSNLEVVKHSKRIAANTSGNLHATANPRGANRLAGKILTDENYFMIPEHLVKKHGTITKASVTGMNIGKVNLRAPSPEDAFSLASAGSMLGVYGALGYSSIVKEPERRVREKRAAAKRKAAREAKALEKARASGVAVVTPPATTAKKTAKKKTGAKAGVVV